MIKILFVCHGNICRSPMAELLLKDMAEKVGVSGELYIASAGISDEEQGNPVSLGTRQKLKEHGISCSGKYARRIRRSDYDDYDIIIGMDRSNLSTMREIFGRDRRRKLHYMLEYAGRDRESVADPWYTGDYNAAWDDIYDGCMGLMNKLFPCVTLDFSACTERRELYDVMSRRMLWQDGYGRNLDALHDILTGMPHHGKSFEMRLPSSDYPDCLDYAKRIYAEFIEAEKPIKIIG